MPYVANAVKASMDSGETSTTNLRLAFRPYSDRVDGE